MLRSMLRTKLWGWTCEANWIGKGTAFTITLPVNQPVIIKETRYDPERCVIEIKGYSLPENNIEDIYKDGLGN
jgi:hypothetical protein